MSMIFKSVDLRNIITRPPIDTGIGFINFGRQSVAPPGPPLPPPPPPSTFDTFSFHDSFNTEGPTPPSNDNRSPDEITPTGLVWINANVFPPPDDPPFPVFDAGIVDTTLGILRMENNISSARINAPSSQVFYEPGGIFIEFTADIDDPFDSALLMAFNVGDTNIQLILAGNAPGAPDELKNTVAIDVVGNNGYAVPYPDNFTTDSFRSAVGDYRNKVLRLELSPDLITWLVDGVPVIQQVPRFTVVTQGTDVFITLFGTYNPGTWRITDMSAGPLA